MTTTTTSTTSNHGPGTDEQIARLLKDLKLSSDLDRVNAQVLLLAREIEDRGFEPEFDPWLAQPNENGSHHLPGSDVQVPGFTSEANITVRVPIPVDLIESLEYQLYAGTVHFQRLASQLDALHAESEGEPRVADQERMTEAFAGRHKAQTTGSALTFVLTYELHEYITEKEAAILTGFSRQQIRRLEAAGEIVSRDVGRKRRMFLAGQFANGGPALNLRETLRALRHVMEDDEICDWLTTPQRLAPGRPTSPLQEMAHGAPLRALRAARACADLLVAEASFS